MELFADIASIFTTCTFLPQVFKTIKMRETRDLSLFMLLLQFIGCFLWVIYGFSVSVIALWLSNIIICTSVFILIVMKVRLDLMGHPN